MKRILLALLIPLAACQKMRNPGTLVYGAIGEITSLDPVFPYDAVSQGTILNVYETLIGFERDRNDKFTPLLAEEVPTLENGGISKDGKTYRFKIRKGVRFHDGKEMKPEDAKYSLLRFMLTDRSGGPSSLLLEPILGKTTTRDKDGKPLELFAEADRRVRVDGDFLVVELPAPFGPFLSVMARWSYVMSRDWAAENGAWDGKAGTWKSFNNPERDDGPFFAKMNGTGPFKLERWEQSERKMWMVRNDAYWREPASIQRVLTYSVSEFSTRKLLLQGGDADIIEVPRPYLAQLHGLKGIKVEDGLPRLLTDPSFFFTMKVNTTANPDIGSGKLDGEGIPPDFFADRDLRKAFAYAFDYNAFINETFKGKAVRAIGAVPPGLLGYDVEGERHSFDPAKAEEHFKKAWGGKVWEKGFKFTLTYNTGGDVREYACQILKKGVEALNPKFRVDLRGLEWAAYLDAAGKRKMPLFSRGWTADYPDAHNFAFPYYHSKGRYPLSQGYENPEFDRLIDAAVREVHPEKRAELYKRIHALSFAEVPQIYTVHPQGVYAMRDWVSGFYDNAVFMGVYFYPLKKGA